MKNLPGAPWIVVFVFLLIQLAGSVERAASIYPPFTLPLKEYVTVFGSGTPGSPGHHQIHVSEYYGRVSVGSPPQEFDMVFDTGSGNIVLPTSKCKDEACKAHRRFVSEKSSTVTQLALDDGTPLGAGLLQRDSTTITYGTGKLTGEYVRDGLCLGSERDADRPSDQMCLMVDFLGVVKESRFPFVELPFDGIVGLGLSGLSAGPGFNFVGKLRADNMREPVFGVFLRNMHADEDSEITFGGHLPERLADPQRGLTWLPVPKDEAESKGYWLVTMREIYVGDRPLQLCSDFGRCRVAMDTGSSLMMGPTMHVNTMLHAIGGCQKPMPTLRFQLDDMNGETFDVVLEASDYVEESESGCATAFQPIDLPDSLAGMWVFGQTALRKYYSVYDAKQWRVGIGLARHASEPRHPEPPASVLPPLGPEKCEDDSESMLRNELPGCGQFAKSGYCERLVPLAHHFCKLSCNLCTPLVLERDESQRSSPRNPEGLSVLSSGFSLKRERRKVLRDPILT